MNNAILIHLIFFLVELLVYKFEQEKCIVSDLQKTLNEEQEKANNVRKLLVVEQNTVRDLKSELCECRQDKERLLKSLDEVQKEVLQLRCGPTGKAPTSSPVLPSGFRPEQCWKSRGPCHVLGLEVKDAVRSRGLPGCRDGCWGGASAPAGSWGATHTAGPALPALGAWVLAGVPLRACGPHRSALDSKEDDLQAALQQLEAERTKERALQSRLEEERLQCLQKEGQSTRTLEVTCAAATVPRGQGYTFRAQRVPARAAPASGHSLS